MGTYVKVVLSPVLAFHSFQSWRKIILPRVGLNPGIKMWFRMFGIITSVPPLPTIDIMTIRN